MPLIDMTHGLIAMTIRRVSTSGLEDCLFSPKAFLAFVFSLSEDKRSDIFDYHFSDKKIVIVFEI